MENKSDRNENKLILGDFSCAMDKMDRDGGNKTQRFSNYAMSKLMLDNGVEDLWKRENPDSSEFIHYDRSSGTRSMIGRVYSDIKITN